MCHDQVSYLWPPAFLDGGQGATDGGIIRLAHYTGQVSSLRELTSMPGAKSGQLETYGSRCLRELRRLTNSTWGLDTGGASGD